MLELGYIIIIIVLSFFALFITIKYLYVLFSIKEIKKRMLLINKINTNILVDAPSQNKDIVQITELFNNTLLDINSLKQKLIHEEIALKNTISNLSHDLRTPITSLLGYTQLLKENTILNEKDAKYIQIIESRIETLKVLVEELFSYSLYYEQEIKVLQKENIGLIIEDVAVMFYEDFKKSGIELILDLGDAPVFKMVDKQALKRVFLNIFNNSIKYGDKEMIVTLNNNQIIFKNKSSQIDKIDVNKIFDRFFTVAKARNNGSMGLGLAIAKILVEKMNGKISADFSDDYFSIIIELNN